VITSRVAAAVGFLKTLSTFIHIKKDDGGLSDSAPGQFLSAQALFGAAGMTSTPQAHVEIDFKNRILRFYALAVL
jgi:hypothetical protein